jgi:hypothetical protein
LELSRHPQFGISPTLVRLSRQFHPPKTNLAFVVLRTIGHPHLRREAIAHATDLAQEEGAVQADHFELEAPRAEGSGSCEPLLPFICVLAARFDVNIASKSDLKRELLRATPILSPPNRLVLLNKVKNHSERGGTQ